MAVHDQLTCIDRAMLTPVVRQALHSDGAVVDQWEVKPISGGLGVAVGAAMLFRISGVAYEDHVERPWSLILKVLRSPSGQSTAYNHSDPGHPTYWKREAIIYRGDFLDRLPPGLSAPSCFDVGEQPERIWLWLEEIYDEVGAVWPLAEYGAAARHIARFNGAYLNGQPLSAEPWMSNGVLRIREASATPFWNAFVVWRDHPRFQLVWPGDMTNRIRRLWEERNRILEALDQLPQVLCHADFDRRNLFARRTHDGQPETVAIDWAFLGCGAIGEDIASLVMSSVLWNMGPLPADLPELSRICYEGYLEGLIDAGWEGDERLARQGYTSALALRFGPFAGAINAIRAEEDAMRVRVEEAFGASFDVLLERFAAVQPFVLDMGDEALDLINAG
jgi:hypothetical protein